MEHPASVRGWCADTSNPLDLKRGFANEHTSVAKAVVIDALLSCVVGASAARQTALHARQRTLSTAVAYIWRFYLTGSFVVDEPVAIAVACLSLAGKVLENPVHDHTKFVKLGQAMAKCVYGTDEENTKESNDTTSTSSTYGPETLLPNELKVLDALKANLTPYDPHFQLSELLGDGNKNDGDKNKKNADELFKTAWAILNDSLLTSLCVSLSERTVALAAIAVACELLDVEPPVLCINDDQLISEKQKVPLAAREMMRYRGAGDPGSMGEQSEEKKTPADAPAGWRARPLMLVGRREEAAEIIRVARKTRGGGETGG